MTENKGGNVFCVRDGVILTPDTVNALEGVSRATVLEVYRYPFNTVCLPLNYSGIPGVNGESHRGGCTARCVAGYTHTGDQAAAVRLHRSGGGLLQQHSLLHHALLQVQRRARE